MQGNELVDVSCEGNFEYQFVMLENLGNNFNNCKIFYFKFGVFVIKEGSV